MIEPRKWRVLRSIEVDSASCWFWTGYLNEHGYGRVLWRKRTWLAHRLSYEAFVGPIPAGLELDHLCRVRSCVNPTHMEPVTHGENVRRGEASARKLAKTHCRHGHPYSGENLIVEPISGSRKCRTCARAAGRRHGHRARSLRRAATRSESALV